MYGPLFTATTMAEACAYAQSRFDINYMISLGAWGGTDPRLLPDMIEVGSFIGMAAMNRSELTIKDVSFENLGIIPAQFARMGIRFEQRGDDIHIPQQDHYSIDTFLDGSIMTIADAPWPGLTPDLLSIFLVVATQANGAVLIHQKMFESRLFFVDKLIDMGAQIILCDPHRATVIGHDHRLCLRATRMTSPAIPAGGPGPVAFVVLWSLLTYQLKMTSALIKRPTPVKQLDTVQKVQPRP